MYTQHTFQDWLAAGDEAERRKLLLTIISTYKASPDFLKAVEATEYFGSRNPAVSGKKLLQAVAIERKDEKTGATRKRTETKEIVGNRIHSNFFFRLTTQLNQYLLGNGLTLDDMAQKEKLGFGFDQRLQRAGECALQHGVCWLYYNSDRVEVIPACTDSLSGCVALLDERTGEPGAIVQFWQIDAKRPLYIRLFEADGVTEYSKPGAELVETAAKRAYRLTVAHDTAGDTILAAENYGKLPVVPLYANAERTSELTPAIKSKIDLYDRILSDFGDNLDKANDVYWVLNNFGGSTADIAEMLETISKLKAVVNMSDGTGVASTATQSSFEVPHKARRAAMELLEKALYDDFLGLDLRQIMGGSLTNVAIQVAMTNLNLKADRYEWQVFACVQQLLALAGVQTEKIRFVRLMLINKSETVQDIQTMRQDIDHATALRLNPYIMPEEIDDIMDNVAAEQLTGRASMGMLERELAAGGGDA